MLFRTIAGLVALLPMVASGQELKQQTTLRVYFVGNSVTDTINYRALAELAKSRGHKHVWGRHMIPGAPLQWIWQHPKDGFQEQPFGHYPNALANHRWDVLSLQPFDRHLEGKDGDIVMAKNFIDLALPKTPDLQVYVYARWPRQGKDDCHTMWQKKYTGGWDGTNETKDYFERLTLALRKEYLKLKKPILLVPVGHVMYELNQRMKAGRVPGYKHIKEVFADGIHLNNVGSYVVGCTFFATLYRENPKGLPGEPYKVTDPKLAEVIQETVWKVVSTHELAGVAAGKASVADRSKSATATAPSNTTVTVAGFLKIKSLVLTKGDRLTYCNMYNDNPHYSFKDFDVFLNPDTGQANINCDQQKSDFNHMVFRTKASAYYHLRLNASKPLEPRVELLHGAKEEEISGLFSAALAEIALKNAGGANSRAAEAQDGLAVEKDGVVFEIVLPERVWLIPENKPGSSSSIHLGLRITNKSDKPLHFNGYDTIIPEILMPDGKEAHRWEGPQATERHRQPQETDFPLVMPGKSVTLSIRTDLFWPTLEDRTLMFRWWHASGSPGRYFDDLKPGPHKVRLVYKNQHKTLEVEYPRRKVLDDNVWTGRIVTPSVQVLLREIGKDSLSTTVRPRVAKAQALRLAKAAAEKDLNARAGETLIELDGKPTIADNEDAWAFTWRGVSKAGGYVVTIRVDNSGQVRVLQSKIGSDRD